MTDDNIPVDHQANLPQVGPALSDAEEDDLALKMANEIRGDWNAAKKKEAHASTRLLPKDIQEQMASELFGAIINHLNTIPPGVRNKVIEKLQAVQQVPERLIIT